MALLTHESTGLESQAEVAALDDGPLLSFQRFLRAISQRYDVTRSEAGI